MIEDKQENRAVAGLTVLCMHVAELFGIAKETTLEETEIYSYVS